MASERKIGGTVFRCEKVPAEEGLTLFGRATKLLGPDTLAIIRDGTDRKKASEEYLVLSLNPEADATEVNRLMIDLAQMCMVGSDQCIVGVKPASMEDTIEVAFFALEVQFKSFLAVALSPPKPPNGSQAA
jgi:hypothetical protein